MELRDLRHALALAEEGSFARAATRVHLSQPALSRSIQALERKLGLVLFDRTPHGALPTAAGRQFLQRAQRLLGEAHNLRHEMGLLRGGAHGELTVGIGPGVAAILLPDLILDVLRSLPGLHIQVEINKWPMLARLLRQESIEFFVTSYDSRDDAPDLTITPLRSSLRSAGFFSRAGHPLAGSAVPLTELRTFPLISTPLPGPVDKMLRDGFGIGPHEPSPFSITCDNLFLLRWILRKSDAVLYTADESMTEEMAGGSVVKIPLTDLAVQAGVWNIAIVSLAGRTLTPAARILIDKLLAQT